MVGPDGLPVYEVFPTLLRRIRHWLWTMSNSRARFMGGNMHDISSEFHL